MSIEEASKTYNWDGMMDMERDWQVAAAATRRITEGQLLLRKLPKPQDPSEANSMLDFDKVFTIRSAKPFSWVVSQRRNMGALNPRVVERVSGSSDEPTEYEWNGLNFSAQRICFRLGSWATPQGEGVQVQFIEPEGDNGASRSLVIAGSFAVMQGFEQALALRVERASATTR